MVCSRYGDCCDDYVDFCVNNVTIVRTTPNSTTEEHVEVPVSVLEQLYNLINQLLNFLQNYTGGG